MIDLKRHFQQVLTEGQQQEHTISSVLHSAKDETRLHSRFIAFLLNPHASHGFDDAFFKLLLKNILQIDFDCTNYHVLQDYQYIDIFIYNDTEAILIENKIGAGDNNPNEILTGEISVLPSDADGHRGKLEQCYHTISTGIDSQGQKIELKRNVTQVAELTLSGSGESPASLRKPPIPHKRICYIHDIINWLTCCIDLSQHNHPIVAYDIHQYLMLIQNKQR